MDSEHGNENRKHFEVNDLCVDSNNQGNDSPPSSSSPSSSDSSRDYILDINALNDKICKFKPDSPDPVAQGPNWTPEVGGQAPQSSSTLTAAHPRGYDPKRIPSAVFASRSTTPVEWSVASNESLFSIQLGNGSFSRDHVYMLYKSGELSKLDEQNKMAKRNDSFKLFKPDEPIIVGKPEQPVHHVHQPSLPVVTEAENMDGKSEDEMDKDSDMSAYTQKVVIVEIAEDHTKKKMMPRAEDVNVSCRSDESPTSAKSFAFPLLGGVGRNSSANMEAEKVEKENQPSTSQPQESPSTSQPVVQPQSPQATTAKSVASSWFSCFYCFSRCC
ncbi:hypothetical protein Dsin_017170 [Dipteronia sinensis]|uniref:Uncharacterized protein n=1 Tax=Dipteronia sinensis TaxID=43782 RepID=A0AAE0E6A3_9ROSI|nr:hypothetical protein Dsin_017170 [Dipteronia sinensis]